MKAVGLRELKNRLSEYVREVRSGESILVTDRGEVVAQLCPPGQAAPEHDMSPGLIALTKRGLLTPGARNDPSLYIRLRPTRMRRRSGELLDEERGSR